jgi:hypothetical protein
MNTPPLLPSCQALRGRWRATFTSPHRVSDTQTRQLKGRQMSIVETNSEYRAVARPLKVLVSLIKQDLASAAEAAEVASKPYYLAIGEKLLEAKGQMERGEFIPWVKRNFNMAERTARSYMSLVPATLSIQNGSARPATFSEAMRAAGYEPRGSARGGASVMEAVRPVLDKIDFSALRQAELKRAEERELQRKLALQIIDIGFKALAAKLHPDKGGSREAMSRLNEVRNRLKSHV